MRVKIIVAYIVLYMYIHRTTKVTLACATGNLARETSVSRRHEIISVLKVCKALSPGILLLLWVADGMWIPRGDSQFMFHRLWDLRLLLCCSCHLSSKRCLVNSRTVWRRASLNWDVCTWLSYSAVVTDLSAQTAVQIERFLSHASVCPRASYNTVKGPTTWRQ